MEKDNNELIYEEGIKRMLDKRKIKYYEVYDSRIADRLIDMKRWFYIIEKKPHFRTNRLVDVWCFEFDKELFDVVKDIKKDIFGGNYNGK